MDSSTDVFMLKKQYLDLLSQDYFTIIFKNIQYKCNIYGVKSSEVIQELLQKNPTLRQYEYNFDESTENFQLICDFFNFKKIRITTKNMVSIRNIAENLKIDAILTDINNYINSYEDIVQKTDPIIELFDWLYQIKELTVENVKNSIIDSIWVHGEAKIKEFSAFILQVVRSSYILHPYLVDLIVSLDESSNEKNDLHLLKPFLVKQLHFNFFKNKFYCCFVYLLSKSGIISIDQIISQIFEIDTYISSKSTKNYDDNSKQLLSDYDKFDSSCHKNVMTWFLAEICEQKNLKEQDILNIIDSKTILLIKNYWPSKLDNYKKVRDTFLPQGEIKNAIFNDDVDTLQSIITKGNININKNKLDSGLFDLFEDDISKSLIDYSAECGAIKCFKYLLLNHATIDESTISYAIIGGNTEIIRTVDQKCPKVNYFNFPSNKQTQQNRWVSHSSKPSSNSSIPQEKYFVFNNKSLLNPVGIVIMLHKNNLFDWLIEEKIGSKLLNDNKILIELAKISVMSGNVHSFIQCVDKGLNFKNDHNKLIEFIKISAEFGFYHMVEFILCIFNSDITKNNIGHSSVIFGNFSISKLLFSISDFSYDYESLLLISIQRENAEIAKYIIENFYQPKKLENFLNIFKYSINEHSSEIFDFFELKFPLDELKKKYAGISTRFMSLLHTSCSKKNFKIFQKLFEFIEKNYTFSDYTKVFLEACYSGSEEIFQYLIDKNVFINFSEIFNQYRKIFDANWKIAIKLIDLVSLEMKKPLSKLFFNESANKKCKEAFVKLLESNLDNKDALFKAINFHDIELIKTILKHNNDPSFINNLSKEGTVLKVAVKNNDLDIVKLLLSIPGIDVGKRISLYYTPLIQAIHDLNIEAIDLLLDYYGENIQSELWQLESAIGVLYNYIVEKEKIAVDNYEDKIVYILNKLYRISINLSTGSRDFISDACQKNSVNFLSKLLNVEGINVNFQAGKTGDTPLITAIKNKYVNIVNLLIDFPNTDINLSNFYGQTPLIVAIQLNMTSIATSIINHPSFDPIKSNINFAFFIINTNNEEILNLLMSKESFDVNYQFDQSVFIETNQSFSLIDTSLVLAIKQMQIKKANLIISHPKFDPIQSNIKEALFASINRNQKELFKNLFEKFGDINIVSYSGKSIFKSLIEHEEFDLLKYVLQMPNVKIEDNCILDYIKIILDLNNKISAELLSILVNYDEKHNHCIDFTHLLPNGKSFFSILNPNNPSINEIVQFLLDHNVNPNQPDSSQIYPLQYAIEYNSLPFVKTLIDSKKIDLTVKLNNSFSYELKNETYLHLAARCSDINILKLFLEQNLIDFNTTDDLGETALIKAKNERKKSNYNLILKYMKKETNSISTSEDENIDDKKSMSEKFEQIQALFDELNDLTSFNDSSIKLVENFKILAKRKEVIKKIQDLFIKLNILEKSINDNDDIDDDNEMHIDINELDFFYNYINHDDSIQSINYLFTSIKKIDYKISSGEIIDIEEKIHYLQVLNKRVALTSQLITQYIIENDFLGES